MTSGTVITNYRVSQQDLDKTLFLLKSDIKSQNSSNQMDHCITWLECKQTFTIFFYFAFKKGI